MSGGGIFAAIHYCGDHKNRVLRGGSYRLTANRCRSAFRDGYGAGIRDWYGGFRVCLVRSPLHSQTAVAEQERTALERRDGANIL